MIYLLPVLKDTTIYEKDPYRNSGLDEVLDLSVQRVGNDLYESRVLLQYNTDKITNILNSENLNYTDLKVLLIMQPVQVSELPDDFIIEATNLDVNWQNGNGYTMFPDTENYIFQENNPPSIYNNVGTVQSSSLSGGANWLQTGNNYFWSSSLFNSVSGGGSWNISSVFVSQSFNYKESIKLELDITELYQSQSLDNTNNGIILKYQNIQSILPSTNMQFYSSETNTIYEPKIALQWNSQVYATGSNLPEITETLDAVVYPYTYKNIYVMGNKYRIYLSSRPRYPRPTFTQNSAYSLKYTLPENSYYRVRDIHTGNIIFDYSEYTKISCNEDGQNYFDFYATLSPERFYRFEIKIDYGELESEHTPKEMTFKVVHH